MTIFIDKEEVELPDHKSNLCKIWYQELVEYPVGVRKYNNIPHIVHPHIYPIQGTVTALPVPEPMV